MQCFECFVVWGPVCIYIALFACTLGHLIILQSHNKRTVTVQRLSERLDINKICGGFINIWERIKIMMRTKRH